ncbi:MAG TPA: hypothetical protein VGD76_13520 [Ramlibacter sp.]
MADEGIKVGDRVSLRTGGPVMSVKARSQNLAYCAWKSDGRLHYGTFEVASLHVAAETPDPDARGTDEGHSYP